MQTLGAEGQLPDQRPVVAQEYRGVYEGPTAGSYSDNKQVWFVFWIFFSQPLFGSCTRLSETFSFTVVLSTNSKVIKVRVYTSLVGFIILK